MTAFMTAIYAPSRFKKLKSTWPTFGWKGNQSIWNNRKPWLTQLQTTVVSSGCDFWLRLAHLYWRPLIRFPEIEYLGHRQRQIVCPGGHDTFEGAGDT